MTTASKLSAVFQPLASQTELVSAIIGYLRHGLSTIGICPIACFTNCPFFPSAFFSFYSVLPHPFLFPSRWYGNRSIAYKGGPKKSFYGLWGRVVLILNHIWDDLQVQSSMPFPSRTRASKNADSREYSHFEYYRATYFDVFPSHDSDTCARWPRIILISVQ